MGNYRASNGVGNGGSNNVEEDSLAVVSDLSNLAFGIVGSVTVVGGHDPSVSFLT